MKKKKKTPANKMKYFNWDVKKTTIFYLHYNTLWYAVLLIGAQHNVQVFSFSLTLVMYVRTSWMEEINT